jgi:hypothetical protein
MSPDPGAVRAALGALNLPRRSKEERQALARQAEHQIDEFMRRNGCADPAAETDADGWRRLKFGDAEGYAYVAESDGAVVFRAAAVLMHLPSDRELTLPLLRELLEINLAVCGPARLGVRGGQVFVALAEDAALMRPQDYGACIHRVLPMADGLGAELKAKYQGTTRARK